MFFWAHTHHFCWERERKKEIIMLCGILKLSELLQFKEESINSFVQSCHTHMHRPTTTMLWSVAYTWNQLVCSNEVQGRGPQLEHQTHESVSSIKNA
jgi:hypothetical protein